MNVELLITTMHATDFSLASRININSSAIIANQADCFGYDEIDFNHNTVKMITTKTTGASLNRNIAISVSTGDVLFVCDDDAELPDNYEELIIKEFESHPYADAIKFFCVCTTEGYPLSLKRPKEFCLAPRTKVFSAGIHAFAIKRSTLMNSDVRFRESIGPGRIHNCGEDSLFLKDLLDNKIKIYLSPVQIGTITRETSTWFTGYNDQYFINSGYVYAKLYKKLAIFAAIRKAILMHKRNKTDLKISYMVSKMLEGISEERNKK